MTSVASLIASISGTMATGEFFMMLPASSIGLPIVKPATAVQDRTSGKQKIVKRIFFRITTETVFHVLLHVALC